MADPALPVVGKVLPVRVTLRARPTWRQVWMSVADEIAQRSLCVRAQVGAVIVTRDNRVQALSYNGPPPGFHHFGQPCTEWCQRALKNGGFDANYDDCCASHAEENAIARADWSQLDGATLVITGAICFKCAKLVAQTGIRHVVHRVDETMAHRQPEQTETFLRKLGFTVERLE